METQKLSVIIITLNEEKDLPGCLDSIKDIADEIIVVDSGSIDRTVNIANKYGAKVYFRNFDNYANQKNYVADKATGEWILSLDADEEISPELATEIRLLITDNLSTFTAYSIPRKNIIFGKFIKYTRWQPELDRQVWLWRNGKGKWFGDVHEKVAVDGKIGSLINPKIHHQYDTVAEFLGMMNHFSDLDAENSIKKDLKFSRTQFLLQPIYNFSVRYFYRLGFLDGWRGFALSYLMAIYHLELWVKIWEKNAIKES
jgi:glycosyltransferase involved in cell wall biosynthesis